MDQRPLRIGIACYPSVGGSGILATSLGSELARRGHEVHFLSYERPFRLPADDDRIRFHPVEVNDYGLFRYPDYTLPLSVKMAEVSRASRLDVLHVHYAVPHATAAFLAGTMLAPDERPRIVTTLHGTDTTLLGHDPGYRPAIRHALRHSDAITAVSAYLARETTRVLDPGRPIDVIPNFYVPQPPTRSPDEVRAELGLAPGETLLLHASNLRPLKRLDLLLEAVAKLEAPFRLLILAGEGSTHCRAEVERLGLGRRVVIRERVVGIEDYLQVADLAVTTSDTESFCLSIVEAMTFACPSLATRVGGIPEVIDDGVTGELVEAGDAARYATALAGLIADPERRRAMGRRGQLRARERFSAAVVVPAYEALYRRTIEGPSALPG